MTAKFLIILHCVTKIKRNRQCAIVVISVHIAPCLFPLSCLLPPTPHPGRRRQRTQKEEGGSEVEEEEEEGERKGEGGKNGLGAPITATAARLLLACHTNLFSAASSSSSYTPGRSVLSAYTYVIHCLPFRCLPSCVAYRRTRTQCVTTLAPPKRFQAFNAVYTTLWRPDLYIRSSKYVFLLAHTI